MMAVVPRRDPLDPRLALTPFERARLRQIAADTVRRIWNDLRVAFNDDPVMIRPEFECVHDVILWLRDQPDWVGTFMQPDLAQVVELDIAPWIERLIALRHDVDSGRRAS
jgi:hypothetical protein